MHFSTWRINGTLAISRAIGDPDCKPHVSAVADVVTHNLDGSEHFIILACDGLWDCVTEEQAASLVYEHLRNDPDNHAELSKLLVQLAKSRASNDNISVVVVLLSSIENILATAPHPVQEQQQLEEVRAPVADGLTLYDHFHQQRIVNGNMEVTESAPGLVSPMIDVGVSSPCKVSQNSSPGEEHHPASTMDFFHNGHSTGDIMTSSFYGNGGADGEDARNLFGDPSDLGPETDVDLLDDEGGEDRCTGKNREASGRGGTLESDGLVVGGGIGGQSSDGMDVWAPRVGGVALSDEWFERKVGKEEAIGSEMAGRFGEMSSMATLQLRSREDEGALQEKKVVEEVDEVRGHPVAVEEDLLVRGGGGVVIGQGEEEEAAYEESEEEEEGEEAEWKYVAAKPIGGGDSVPEAVSPEIAHESVKVEEVEGVPPTLERRHGGEEVERLFITEDDDAADELTSFKREESKEIPGQEEAGLIKFCGDFGFGVAQGIQVKDDAIVKGVSALLQEESPFDDLEQPLVDSGTAGTKEEFEPLDGELKQVEKTKAAAGDLSLEELLEDSTMESRLNPDAAEFVPVSPTRNLTSDSVIGGQEFDVFRKEAEACPGEVFGAVTGLSTAPKEEVKFMNEQEEVDHLCENKGDLDAVLSSSFNHDVCRGSIENVERLTLGVECLDLEQSDNINKDENKENIAEFDDGCNMHQNSEPEFMLNSGELTCSPDGSVEILEESFIADKTSSFVAPQDPSLVKYVFGSESATKLLELGSGQCLGYQLDVKVDDVQLGKSAQSPDVQPECVVEKQLHLSMSEEMLENKEFDNLLINSPSHNVSNSEREEVVNNSIDVLPSTMLHELQENKTLLMHETDQIHGIDEHVPSLTREEGPLTFESSEKVCDLPTQDRAVTIPKADSSESFDMLQDEEFALKNENVHKDIETPSQTVDVLCPTLHEQMQALGLGNAPIFQICPQKPVDDVENINPILEEKRDNDQFYLDEKFSVAAAKDVHQGKLADLETAKGELVEPPTESKDPLLEASFSAISFGSVGSCEEHSEIKIGYEDIFSSNLVSEEKIASETAPCLSTDTLNPVPVLDASSEVEVPSRFNSSEEKVPVVVESLSKHDLGDLLEVTSGQAVTVETKKESTLVDTTTKLVESGSYSEDINPPEEVHVVETSLEMDLKNEVNSSVNVSSEDPRLESTKLDQNHVESVSGLADDAIIVTAAVGAALVTGAIVSAVEKTSPTVEVKQTAKKTMPVDKKKVPEKNKVPPTSSAVTKGKLASKTTSLPPSRTNSSSAKAPITSPTKAAGTSLVKPTVERKTAAPAPGKSLASAKSTTSPSQAPKSRLSMTKPSAPPLTRPTTSSRTLTSTSSSRPGTATSKTGPSSTLPKTAATATKSAGVPATNLKSSEVKRSVNGEAAKAPQMSGSVANAKPQPRKTVPQPTGTTLSKPATSVTKPPPARLSSASHKVSAEPLPSKSRTSKPPPTATNGTASKTARPTSAPISKPSAAASSRTKTQTSTKTESAPGDPKRAKESANKHISASRTSVGVTSSRRVTDVKGSAAAASKSTSPVKGPVPVLRRSLANGTTSKKTIESLDSKKVVDQKVELVISSQTNGITSETTIVTKEVHEESVEMGGGDGGEVQEKKEMLIVGGGVEELSVVGEAV